MRFKAWLDRFVHHVRPVAEPRPAAARAIEAVRTAPAPAAPPGPSTTMAARFSASTRADTYAIQPETARPEPPSRRRGAEEEAALSDAAADWVFGLPAALRPEWTVLLFPRIANRMARCWRDTDLLDALFDDLLHDRRSQGAGLPPQVRDEIARLDRHRRRDSGAAALPQPVPAEAIDILL